MKIPKSVKVGRKRYTVAKSEKLAVRGECTFGHVNHFQQHIQVATHHPRTGRELPQAEQSDTFWHELTHAILYDMGHHLYRNEEFVTRFSSRLNKAILSAEL